MDLIGMVGEEGREIICWLSILSWDFMSAILFNHQNPTTLHWPAMFSRLICCNTKETKRNFEQEIPHGRLQLREEFGQVHKSMEAAYYGWYVKSSRIPEAVGMYKKEKDFKTKPTHQPSIWLSWTSDIPYATTWLLCCLELPDNNDF